MPKGVYKRIRRKACRRGHPWTKASTRVDRSGWRACRICNREYKKAIPRETRRFWDWFRRYRLSKIQAMALLRKQRNACAVCKKPLMLEMRHSVCVDHDHATKQVRGFVHPNCNLILGHAKDNIALLKQAVRYLETNRV
jgi:hypothetical protein